MNYRIEENHEYNSREVYFDEKPVDAVRLAMKRLKMRWHGQKNVGTDTHPNMRSSPRYATTPPTIPPRKPPLLLTAI